MKTWWSWPLAAVLLSGCGGGGEESACKEVSFPAPPSDAAGTLFVAAGCPAEDANGSREHPFVRIGDAIAAAAPGATILIAAETSYEENLTVDRSVRLLAAPPDTFAESASVTLRPTTGVGVYVSPGVKNVLVRGLIIERAKGIGAWVTNDANAVLDAVFVHNTEPDGDGQFGYGVLANEGAAIQMKRTTVAGAPAVGVYVNDAWAIMEELDVSGVTGHGCIRLENARDIVVVKDSIVDQCTEVGILVSSSKAAIEKTNVLHTTLGESAIGDGIVVSRRKDDAGMFTAEAEANITGAIVTQASRVGVLFSDGATGSLVESTVTSNVVNNGRGAGVWIQSGAGGEAGILVSKNSIRMNHFTGIGVTSGAVARITENEQISETMASEILIALEYVLVGDGIGVFGARATIESNVISANSRFGVLMDNPAPGTTIASNEIRNNNQFGLVIQHPGQGIPTFSTNEFTNNGSGPSVVLGVGEMPFPFHEHDFVTP